MFQMLTDQEKFHRYPTAPDYSSATTELFSLAGKLVCFALADTSSTVKRRRASGLSFFLGPDTFIWVPGKVSYAAPDKQAASETAISLFRSHGSNIHVFVRRTAVQGWLDVGSGLLNGMHLIERTLADVNVQLGEKLTESLWLEFGGRPGWTLCVNSEEVETSSPESVIRAVRAAWDRHTVDVEITRYTGDTLFAIADEAGRATVNYRSDQGVYLSRAAQPPSERDSPYVFARSDNYDLEVPVEQVVSKEEALSIIEGFVLTGNTTGLFRLS